MVAKLLRVCYHVLRPSRLCIRIRMPTATSHATRLLPLQRPSRSVARMCRPDRRPHGGSSRSHGRLHASSRWRAVHIRCVMLLACYFEAAKSGLVRQRCCGQHRSGGAVVCMSGGTCAQGRLSPDAR